jgi:hypothetical protein
VGVQRYLDHSADYGRHLPTSAEFFAGLRGSGAERRSLADH